MPGIIRSLAYFALPVTLSTPSTRGTDLPTTEKSRVLVLTETPLSTLTIPRWKSNEKKSCAVETPLPYNGHIFLARMANTFGLEQRFARCDASCINVKAKKRQLFADRYLACARSGFVGFLRALHDGSSHDRYCSCRRLNPYRCRSETPGAKRLWRLDSFECVPNRVKRQTLRRIIGAVHWEGRETLCGLRQRLLVIGKNGNRSERRAVESYRLADCTDSGHNEHTSYGSVERRRGAGGGEGRFISGRF